MVAPEFQLKTIHYFLRRNLGKFVFARLDREMPVDREQLTELSKTKLIFPVNKHAFLRRRFQQAGYLPNMLEDLYVVAMRKPAKEGLQTLHGRSYHTVGLPEGRWKRQLVLKGIGTAEPSEQSFKLNRQSDLPEVQFSGAARASTIKRAVDILQQLEAGYAKAKRKKDPVVQWAEQEWGIRELPVIKHVAVFRPLQFLDLTKKEAGSRVRLTRQALEKLGLEYFHGEERIHLYTARQPKRINEDASVYERPVIQDHETAPKKEMFFADAIQSRTIARGLLLLHIAHRNHITLTSEYGSSLAHINASPLEFFDFDTGERHKKTRLEWGESFTREEKAKDWDFKNLARTFQIHFLRQLRILDEKLDHSPEKMEALDNRIAEKIREAMQIANARFMLAKAKRKRLTKKVEELLALSKTNTSKWIKD